MKSCTAGDAGSAGGGPAAAIAKRGNHHSANTIESAAMKCIVGWLGALLIVASSLAPARGAESSSSTSTANEPPSPFLPYAVAGLSTVLILFTICKPSGKEYYED